MRSLLIYEANCRDLQSDEIEWEIRENNNLRRIAIELFHKKDEANKSFIKILAKHVYPKLKNLTSAELTLWDYYIPETLTALNDKLTNLSLQIEGTNFDFL